MHLIAFLNKEISISLRKERAELIACFFIAAVFWFLVKLSQTYETERAFRFEYVLPEGEAFLERPPAEVQATVSGSGWKLMYASLFRPPKTVVLDLNSLPLSVLERRLVMDRIQNALAGEGLLVKDINLDYIALRVDARATRRLPLELRYKIEVAPQHQLSRSLVLKPDSIEVSGPADVIDALDFWPTDTGRIGPLKAPFSGSLPLAEDATGVLEFNVDKTLLDVQVEPVVEKTLFFVPVAVINAPDSIRIFPSSATVYCALGMSHYSDLEAGDFTLEADLAGIAPNSPQNTVPINLTCYPDYVRNVRFSPQSVEFFFQRVE
jgi:hypothetical protein